MTLCLAFELLWSFCRYPETSTVKPDRTLDLQKVRSNYCFIIYYAILYYIVLYNIISYTYYQIPKLRLGPNGAAVVHRFLLAPSGPLCRAPSVRSYHQIKLVRPDQNKSTKLTPRHPLAPRPQILRLLGLKTLNNRLLGPSGLTIQVLGCSGYWFRMFSTW